jgi:hypothetical protein
MNNYDSANKDKKRLTLKNSVAYIDDSLLPEMVFLIPKRTANKRFIKGLGEEFITVSVYMDRTSGNDPLLLLDLEPGTFLNLRRKCSNNGGNACTTKQNKNDKAAVDDKSNKDNNNKDGAWKYGHGQNLYITKLFCQVDSVEILKGGRHAEISVKLLF